MCIEGSFYLRSDQPGLKVAFYLRPHDAFVVNQICATTTDWRQCTTAKFSVTSTGSYSPRIILLSPGTIWIDVVELVPVN